MEKILPHIYGNVCHLDVNPCLHNNNFHKIKMGIHVLIFHVNYPSMSHAKCWSINAYFSSNYFLFYCATNFALAPQMWRGTEKTTPHCFQVNPALTVNHSVNECENIWYDLLSKIATIDGCMCVTKQCFMAQIFKRNQIS